MLRGFLAGCLRAPAADGDGVAASSPTEAAARTGPAKPAPLAALAPRRRGNAPPAGEGAAPPPAAAAAPSAAPSPSPQPPPEMRKSFSGTSTASGSLISAAWQRLAPGGAAAAAAARAAAAAPPSEDMASTSYPSWPAGSDDDGGGRLAATVLSAREAEAAVDFVLEGSAKSAAVLFGRYDMDVDGALRQQDMYDLLLELNLSLAYEDYQRLIDFLFEAADHDRDGSLALAEFSALYKLLAALRRAFKRADLHFNGHIDRHDFGQLLIDLGVVERGALVYRSVRGDGAGGCGCGGGRDGGGGRKGGAGGWRGGGGGKPCSGACGRPGDSGGAKGAAGRGGGKEAGSSSSGVGGGGVGGGGGGAGNDDRRGRLRELVEHGFSVADRAGRGSANFGEVLLWFSQYIHALGVPAPDENGDVWMPPSGLAAPVCIGL
ncbi:hypothetical protein Rsub_10259 [Raphidocelis subcapitata]|uniref:EF-hand domain-containing protein n=1 Tax=Raphidocelis subcapitata TaxID=307507 RepID=A0A2V0PDH8_9CHLO|nr:hypothetical protein Rsub_10259 [Raphidocelis subcapitata]|eukprot:GBF97904.1 hypothetical protein Rsub_10259 [Raphidocelis subcapitata]